jgi:hypothetical protein
MTHAWIWISFLQSHQSILQTRLLNRISGYDFHRLHIMSVLK